MNAVLIVGIWVVSVFQYPLGNPVYRFIPMEDMATCEANIQYYQPQVQISSEFAVFTQTQCMTMEEFEAATRQAQGGR